MDGLSGVITVLFAFFPFPQFDVCPKSSQDKTRGGDGKCGEETRRLLSCTRALLLADPAPGCSFEVEVGFGH